MKSKISIWDCRRAIEIAGGLPLTIRGDLFAEPGPDPFRRRSWSHKAPCPRTSVTKPSGCCTPAAISSSAAAPGAATRRCSTRSLPSSPTTSGSSPSRTPWSSASTPRTASGSRRAGYSREPSRSATSCATPCGTGPITSSSAKCAAPKRPTCCKPSTPDTAARPPRHHPGERLPPRGRAGRPDPAALGQQSVSRR